MKSIERKFNNIQLKNPNYSSIICFTSVVLGAKFTPRAIRKWFNRLVEKEDYDKADKKAILENLTKASKALGVLVLGVALGIGGAILA